MTCARLTTPRSGQRRRRTSTPPSHSSGFRHVCRDSPEPEQMGTGLRQLCVATATMSEGGPYRSRALARSCIAGSDAARSMGDNG